MRVNLDSVFAGSRVAARRMAARGRGHLVNTASISALGLCSAGTAAYAASKYAVMGLSEVLRQELAPQGVGVSVLCPGPVRTNLWKSTRRLRGLPELDMPPAGRIPRSLAPQMSKSGSHRRKWRCEIQRRPSSLDVAMVDRGQDVASLAGSDDAAARRARAGARYCLAGSGDAREKKPPRSRAAPGEGRGAITACNAPGRRSPTHFRPGRFRAARRTLRLPARATSSAGWNPSRTSAGTSPA